MICWLIEEADTHLAWIQIDHNTKNGFSLTMNAQKAMRFETKQQGEALIKTQLKGCGYALITTEHEFI